MRSALFIFVLSCLAHTLSAQNVYTIKADSVKLTNCDSSELIIENHTQNVPGFLFNTGNGRTVFKRGLLKLNDSLYLIGGDSLKYNAWVQGGNRFGTTGLLGTLDNNHLDFYTNNAARGRWTNTGNLLVGTTTDNGYKLYVNGKAGFNSSLNAASNSDVLVGLDVSTTFNNGSFTGAGNVGIRTNSYISALGLTLGATAFVNNLPINSLVISGVSPATYYVGSGQGFSHSFRTGNSGVAGERLRITDSIVVVLNSKFVIGAVGNNGNALQVTGTGSFTGNVGIGIGNPTAQLHTTGAVRFAGLTSDTTKTRVIVSDANGTLYYRDASSLAINGILNSSLAVNGTVSAQRLKLSQTGWPDYVFDSSYRLPSLKELEEYIQKNKHLPGITSAKEAAQAGIDIGDNQAALLRKIEELTLYSIEQDKKLQAQNEKTGEMKNLEDTLKQQGAELKTLKQEIAELRKLIENKSGE